MFIGKCGLESRPVVPKADIHHIFTLSSKLSTRWSVRRHNCGARRPSRGPELAGLISRRGTSSPHVCARARRARSLVRVPSDADVQPPTETMATLLDQMKTTTGQLNPFNKGIFNKGMKAKEENAAKVAAQCRPMTIAHGTYTRTVM